MVVRGESAEEREERQAQPFAARVSNGQKSEASLDTWYRDAEIYVGETRVSDLIRGALMFPGVCASVCVADTTERKAA